MKEFILIGDVHATATELDECQRLLELLQQVKLEHPWATPVFLGDQFHTNDVMSVRVMEWWRNAALKFGGQGPADGKPVFVVGNHDQAYPGAVESAMSSCKDVAIVVDGSIRIEQVLFVAYSKDPEVFARRAADDRGGMLVCHQDLYGFEHDDGVSRSSVPVPEGFVQVVSGHLHRPQERGRGWYPGSPRWRNRHDATVVERSVWWVEVSNDGKIVRRQPYVTNECCRRIVVSIDTTESPAVLVPGADNRVTIHGTPDFIGRRREVLKAEGAIVTGVPERTSAAAIGESMGLEVSMRTHLNSFSAPRGTGSGRLQELLRERLGVTL